MKFDQSIILSSMNKAGFLARNPKVVPRVLKNYFVSLIFSKKPLRTVDITFDYRCNYNCKHCYTHNLEDKNRKLLTYKEIIENIDKCIKEGAIHFNIIGGEPTIHPDLFRLISYIHNKGALVSLATNGSMLTREYVSKLKNCRLDVALISLDYLDEDEQDQLTGHKGSFLKTSQAIENCIAVGLPVFISTVVTKYKLQSNEFNKILDFCRNKKITCHINLPTLYGRWKTRKDLIFNKQEIQAIKDLYKDPHVRSCEMSAYFVKGCSPGLEKLHITPYGDVLPCAFIPISFGNIKRDSISIIRDRMHKFSFFNSYNDMCIPSTNKKYYDLFDKMIQEREVLPVDFEELGMPLK
jgi:MoaA/NifB/PqqE/SkfB family radical SAM enzyme